MRCIILFLLIVSSIVANARHVSFDEAQAIAFEFFNGNHSKSAPKRIISSGAGNQQDEVPYYIFNASDDNGFVIISGDTRGKKIIGYSNKGSFDTDKMPPQLSSMLEQYSKQWSKLPESCDESWSISQISSEDGVVLLETARWNQQYPFNLMTPNNCVTGCVPTAVAIIMRYHKWPETGYGSTSYELNGHSVSFDFDNAHFDWDLMPLDYIEGQYTEEQALEVSKAMYAAGNAVHAGFGEAETFANLPAYGMYRYLKYEVPKRNVVLHDALELCLNKFLQTVHSEISSCNPMLLDVNMYAYVDHFVVADGFDSQNNVHLNYGWGGSCNGFYNPEIIINNTNYFYSNIRPDRINATDREEILPDDGALSNSNSGGPLQSGLVILGEIKPNVDFGFIYHIAFPIEPLPNFRLGLLHITSQGSIKDILWSDTPELSLNNGDIFGQSNATILKGIEDDDRVSLAYKKEEADEWHIMKDTPNAKASMSITAQERDYLHFTVVSDPDVDFTMGYDAIIEDQKDSWNYCGKIEKCHFNPRASVNEPYMLGPFSLQNNIGCATISINGVEIGRIGCNYLNEVPLIETEISNASNLVPYLSDSITVEVKKYLYDEMLVINKHVDKAGTLDQMLTLADAKNTRSLTLTGQIDESDLKFVENNCPFLQILDMSDADIVDGVLPSTAYFESIKILQQIKLPRNLKSIESNAFMDAYGQGGIRIVYVPEGVEEIGDRAFMLGAISSVVMSNPKPIDIRGRQDAPFRRASVIYVPKGSKLAYENAGWGWSWNGDYYERKVIEYDGDFIPIDSISFSPETITMNIGESLTVNPIIHPKNASEQWTGSLRLNDLGRGIILKDNNCIEAVKEGCGFLSVNHSNLYSYMLVNVGIKVSEIILNKTTMSLVVGENETLTATIIPEDATDKGLEWRSSDETVAVVDGDGNVSVLKEGSCVITASAVDGSGVYAECVITSISGVEGIFLEEEAFDVYDVNGLVLKRGAKRGDLKMMTPGVYLIRQGERIRKVFLRNN